MNFHVMTLFPEMIEQGVHTSITGRALDKGTIHLNAVDIRRFSNDKHGHVDDYPYGGGAGMVMQPQPVYDCYRAICDGIKGTKAPRVIYMTPQGKVFSQAIAEELSREEDLIFLCGHYEGIDERVLDEIVTDNLSIGDYVLTGGELAAMVMIDAIARLVPGVLNNEESSQYESFQDGLLEYPQYTRPPEFHGRMVPEILLSGNHVKIEEWRRKQSLERTWRRRPELFRDVELSKNDAQNLAYIRQKIYYESPKDGENDHQGSVLFDNEVIRFSDLLSYIQKSGASDTFTRIELNDCLNHLFPKDVKKVLKFIAKHIRKDTKIHLNISVLQKENWICIEKNVYTDGNLIWYCLPQEIWMNILSQWFAIQSSRTNDEMLSFCLSEK